MTALYDIIRGRVPTVTSGPRTPDEIASVATIVAEQFRPYRIILFGSHAYGDPTHDSDVDLMVIMPVAGRPQQHATRIRQAVGRSYRFPMDIMVRTPQQIAAGLANHNFFLEDVLTKGITLFEATDT